MVNAGDETFIYYTAFTPTGDRMEGRTNLGVARMPRERFGSLVTVADAAFGQVVTAVIGAGPETWLAANTAVEPAATCRRPCWTLTGSASCPALRLRQRSDP